LRYRMKNPIEMARMMSVEDVDIARCYSLDMAAARQFRVFLMPDGLHSSHARCVLMERSGSQGRTWLVWAAIAALLPIAAAKTARAQEPDNPLHTATRLELDVVKAVLVQEKAWNTGDLEGYEKGYKDSPDTIFIGKQVSRGFAQMVDDYKHNYPTRASMGTLGFSELEVHPLSETFAVCLGKYHVDRSKKEGGPTDGLFSLVLEKTDKGWKIVLDHTT
jgi:ketosteroid isomerase-like protein